MSHLVIRGKRDKLRYVPLHLHAGRLIDAYLEALEAVDPDNREAPLFCVIRKGDHIMPQGDERRCDL